MQSGEVFSPEITNKPSNIIVDEKSNITIGPSGLHDTDAPFLAKHLELGFDVINDMEISNDIKEVDKFILDIMEERNFTDSNEAYLEVYNEIINNLGINNNTNQITKLEQLLEGVRILKQQNLYKNKMNKLKETIYATFRN